MTKEEAEAIKQRTRDEWAKYLASCAPCVVEPFFKTEAERQQHMRAVEEAQKNGSPF